MTNPKDTGGEPALIYAQIPSLEFTSNHPENNLRLMAAMNEIVFWEDMKILMPMVAKELVKAGVIFKKSDALLRELGKEEK